MLEQLETIIKRNIPLTLDACKVLSVSGDVCKVKSLDTGKEYFKVAVNAVRKNGESYLKITPKEGSTVIIGIVPGENQGFTFIVSVSEVTELLYKVDSVNLNIDKEGFKIQRGEENLKKILDELLDEKNKMNKEVQKIAKKAGAADSIPVLIEIFTQVELIKARLNTLLKE